MKENQRYRGDGYPSHAVILSAHEIHRRHDIDLATVEVTERDNGHTETQVHPASRGRLDFEDQADRVVEGLDRITKGIKP